MNKPRIHLCDKIPNDGHMFLVTERSVYSLRNIDKSIAFSIVPITAEIESLDWKACPYCGEVLINEEVTE